MHQLISGSDGRIHAAVQNEGVVRFDANGGNYTVLSTNNLNEDSSLIEGQDGLLYVVAALNTGGAFYRMNKDGSNFTVLQDPIPFSLGQTLQQPIPCCAFQAADGFIYGAESTLTLQNFFFRTDTNFPAMPTHWTEAGPLNLLGFLHSPTTFFQATDGLFYGAFSGAESFAPQGYLFRWETLDHPLASRTNRLSWPPIVGGPSVTLTRKSFLEGADGRFYGVADGGGRHNGGMVFRVNKDGGGFTNLMTRTDPATKSCAASPVRTATANPSSAR